MEMTQKTPWSSMNETDREAQLRLSGGARPIRWTLDVTKVNTLDEDGCVFVFAGGPLQGPGVPKAPRVRADGKTDGRSAGVRKCGRCQGTGHNARTCRKTPVAKPPSPVKASSGRKCGRCQGTGHNARTCRKKKGG